MPDSTDLLNRAIAHLEQLATEFATELELARPSPRKTHRHLRQKEALLTISILLPKLAAVRQAEPSSCRGAAGPSAPDVDTPSAGGHVGNLTMNSH
jgi:hypothetical protein